MGKEHPLRFVASYNLRTSQNFCITWVPHTSVCDKGYKIKHLRTLKGAAPGFTGLKDNLKFIHLF